MSKDDLPPCPERPPKKRKALNDAPDIWLRTWLERSNLTPSERKKVQEVVDHRRAERKRETVRLGVLVGHEGMTPQQVLALENVFSISGMELGSIHLTWVPSKIYQMCVRRGVSVVVHEGRTWTAQASEVVKNSDLIIAAPKETQEPVQKVTGSVWGMVKYAKHRSVPVKVIEPGGNLV